MMEANIISFRVFLDKRGRVLTELSFLPEKEIKNVFEDEETRNYMRVLLRECHLKFDSLHDYLEKNIQALNHE